jgi:hypothetical protein
MKSSEEKFVMRDEYDFSKGVRGRFYQPRKKATAIRLDDDLILFFKRRQARRRSATRPWSTQPCGTTSAAMRGDGSQV